MQPRLYFASEVSNRLFRIWICFTQSQAATISVISVQGGLPSSNSSTSFPWSAHSYRRLQRARKNTSLAVFTVDSTSKWSHSTPSDLVSSIRSTSLSIKSHRLPSWSFQDSISFCSRDLKWRIFWGWSMPTPSTPSSASSDPKEQTKRFWSSSNWANSNMVLKYWLTNTRILLNRSSRRRQMPHLSKSQKIHRRNRHRMPLHQPHLNN